MNGLGPMSKDDFLLPLRLAYVPSSGRVVQSHQLRGRRLEKTTTQTNFTETLR